MTYFETIRCDDFEVFNLEYHKKRIANTIGLNLNLEEYIYPPNEKLLKCKVLYNQYEVLDIIFDEYTPKHIKSFKLVFDDDIEYKYKSTNREVIDNLYKTKKNSDEIIIIKNNLVTDTSIANIAILIDNQWYTPRIPLLKGTCRERLIASEFLKEKDITIDILKKSEKIAVMNAMIDFKIIEDFELN